MKNTLCEVNKISVPRKPTGTQVRMDFVGDIVEREKDSKFSRWVATHVLNTERLRTLWPYFAALLIFIAIMVKV